MFHLFLWIYGIWIWINCNLILFPSNHLAISVSIISLLIADIYCQTSEKQWSASANIHNFLLYIRYKIAKVNFMKHKLSTSLINTYISAIFIISTIANISGFLLYTTLSTPIFLTSIYFYIFYFSFSTSGGVHAIL